MKKLTMAMVVGCVAVLLPCVANGAGSEGGKQLVSPAAPSEGMIRADGGAAVSARVGMPASGARDVVRNPGLDLRSVSTPGDLANTLSRESPLLSPTTTYWYTVSGTNFAKVNGSGPTVQGGNACVYTTDGAELTAPVLLPQGAVVTQMWMGYNRTGAYTSTANLYTFQFYGLSGAYVLPSLSASSTAGHNFDLVLGSGTISNTNNDYILTWDNTANAGNQLCSIQLGYNMPATGTYNPVTPCRRIDTRTGIGTTATPLTTANRNLQISGGCGVPTGATGITANVTVVNDTVSGYVAIWPQGTAWPGNSTLNYTAGSIVANAADLVLSSSGQVTANCNAGTTDLIIDITGYFY